MTTQPSEIPEPPASAPLVHARGIVKSFRVDHTRIPVLKGVDLDVAAGEVLLLVGPSGSGKTTLLSVIAGILDADEGTLTVLDRDLFSMTEDEKTAFRREAMGFVFQQFNLLPTLTATENVAVPLLIRGLKKEAAFARAIEVLKTLGMGGRLTSTPSHLSGGEQQRVAIARALVTEPRLLLCDEPTANLDAETGHRVVEALCRVGKRPDRAMIIVTHDTRIFEFGDRLVHMDDGRIREVQHMNEEELR
ncbi:MAG: ABC transporter ATP-binding protein [Nitrospirae bacterium]|nr:MAG: ABC transporter ATP-binding protein [Nitrospirota bacterium]